MTISLLRAALVAALSISAVSAQAQIKNAKSETYKDIIEKAYNLSLQRDRQQALNILSGAIHRETRPQAVNDLKKTVSEISNLFFSDKAQQLFEVGLSLRKTDLNQAFDKMSEASRIEPDNFLIVAELARLTIAKGECKQAQDVIRKHLQVITFDEDLKLAMAQAWACQKKWSEYNKLYDAAAVKKSNLAKFWYALEVDKDVDLESNAKAQENLANLKKADDKFPELFYWTWKADSVRNKPNMEAAQKYVMTCKNISANHYRQYMIDPMLCRRVSEVENELKGMNGLSD